MISWQKDIWISTRKNIEDNDGEDLAIYNEPKHYKINYQPMSSYLDYQKYTFCFLKFSRYTVLKEMNVFQKIFLFCRMDLVWSGKPNGGRVFSGKIFFLP